MKYEKWTKEKIAGPASLCKTKQEMRERFPKEYAAAKRMGILGHPMFSHMPQHFKNGISSKWGKKEDVLKEAAKYNSKKEFFKANQSCYSAAKRRGWFEEACAHMPKNKCIGNKPATFKWPKEAVAKEALKYTNKKDFRVKSAGAWDAAVKNKWVAEVCAHMEVFKRSYSLEQVRDLFASCKTKKEAREKDSNAYIHARNNGWGETVFAHMPERIDLSGDSSPFYKGSDGEIKEVALLYDNKIEFLMKDPALYQRAYKRGILGEICSHMGKSNDGSSFPERELFGIIRAIRPSAKKIRDMGVKIKGKPHIHGFDIDIFIPELNKGIEFDGTWIHSFEGLKRSRPNWPDKDLRNYHKLKDNWFKSKGIKILHIKQRDWKKDKDACIQKCLDFLNN